MEAVQFKVVPELVVPEAANPAGTLGADEQPPPPLLDPLPQDGRIIKPADMIQISDRPNSLFRRRPRELKPRPISASPGTIRPGTTIHDAYNRRKLLGVGGKGGAGTRLPAARRKAALPVDPTVVKVTVAFTAAAPVIETGLVFPNEQVGAPAPVTTGEMLHDRVTLPVYPPAGVTVTLAVDEEPAFTDAGVVV